jgi:hypothetical protein
MKTNNLESERNPGPAHTPKPLPIYIQDVSSISPLLQLLKQIAAHQYEKKSPGQQPDQSSNCDYSFLQGYHTKALAEKQTEFHTYKPKEERSYRVVLPISRPK